MDIRFNYMAGSPNNEPFERLDAEGNAVMVYAPAMIKGGFPMEVIDIQSVDFSVYKNTKKEKMPVIQMFDCGYRITKDCGEEEYTEKFKHWNGCVFIDLDSKKYNGIYAEQLKNTFDLFIEKSSNNLSEYTESRNNFYFAQKSASGNSAHFVFYYNVEHTEVNFLLCCNHAQKCVVRCIKTFWAKCAEDIISDDEILDKCSRKPMQFLYMSGNPLRFNDRIRLYGGISGETDCCDEEYQNTIESDDDFGLNVNDVTFNSVTGNETYNGKASPSEMNRKCYANWQHNIRWNLLKVFCAYFGADKKAAMACYESFLPTLAQYVGNHTEQELKRLFSAQYMNTLKSVQRKSKTANLSRLMIDFCCKYFGFTVKKFNTQFVPKRIVRSDYDEIIRLKDGEYMSDYIKHIMNLPHNLIHIEAGCGVGKTRSAIKFIEDDRCASVQDIWNIAKTKRICFVTPMTSINGNNFDMCGDASKDSGKQYWMVIDSNHKGNDNIKAGLSVCTTWNSFVNDKYSMVEADFDAYIFDEAHSLYLYDYRTDNITDVKKEMSRLIAMGKKVILMSGTPSKEREMENMYKIKLERQERAIPAHITVYNSQYMGWLIKDIKKWLKASKDNCAIIFNDRGNQEMKERFERRGISIDCVYNKQFTEDVNYVNNNRDVIGRVTLVSAYGQAGINIETSDSRRFRVYIINTNAMSIIQYANRLRNKKAIESINLFYRRDELHSAVKQMEGDDYGDVVRRVASLNAMQKQKDKSIFSQDERYINLNLNLSLCYLDIVNNENGRRYFINNDHFVTYNDIMMQNEYEKQMQVIYNRLIDAYFEPQFEYLEEDVEDSGINGKFHSTFASAISMFNIDMMKENKKGEFSVDAKKCGSINRWMVGDVKKHLEHIYNYFRMEENTNGNYVSDAERRRNIQNKYNEFLSHFNDGENSIKKINLAEFCEIIKIKEKFNKFADEAFAYHIWHTENMTDEDMMQDAVRYVIWMKSLDIDNEIEHSHLFIAVEEAYQKIKRLRKLMEKFDWFIDWDRLKTKKIEGEWDVELAGELFSFLRSKHTRGAEGKSINVYRIDNGEEVWCGTYPTIRDCAKAVGVDETAITRCIKKSQGVMSRKRLKFVQV